MKMKEMLKNAIIDALNSHKLDEVVLSRYLQQIADEAEYNLWFFGHFHEDEVIEDVFIAMYDEIVVAN